MKLKELREKDSARIGIIADTNIKRAVSEWRIEYNKEFPDVLELYKTWKYFWTDNWSNHAHEIREKKKGIKKKKGGVVIKNRWNILSFMRFYDIDFNKILSVGFRSWRKREKQREKSEKRNKILDWEYILIVFFF